MKRRNQSRLEGRAQAGSGGKRPSAEGRLLARLAGASSGWPIGLALAVVALAAVAVYGNGFANGFVFDDGLWIERNDSIRHLWPIWSVLFPSTPGVGGRPVVSLTLAINYALGGTNVWGYHAMNLAIHILAAWTLLGIVRRTLTLPYFRGRFDAAATLLALLVSLLWLIHPLQTESVTYIIQRTEALMGLFYLLVLYCVIRGATSGGDKRWYVAAAGSCLLGIATKEVTVTAPVVVLLYDRTFLAGSFREAWRRRYGLYLVLASMWIVVAAMLISTDFYGGTTGFAVQELATIYPVQKFTWWSYLLTESGVIMHYLRLVFWPSGLCLSYAWPPAQTVGAVVVPGIVVLGLVGLTLWALAKRPAWGFLGAWFFAILAPTSSFVPIADAAFEHRMYLSLAAVIAGVVIGGWLTGQWLVGRGSIQPTEWRMASMLPLAAAGMALAAVTIERNRDYRSEMTIWRDTADKAPRNALVHYNLGFQLTQAGRGDEAMREYEKALQITPDYEQAHNNLGATLLGMGRLDEAFAQFRGMSEVNPRCAEAHFNMGAVQMKRKQMNEAIACFQKALDIDPEHIDARYSLGVALGDVGRSDEAMAEYRKVLEHHPEHAPTHNKIGAALARGGQFAEAVVEFRKALAAKPNASDTHNGLGIALAECGQLDQAIVEFQKALELDPNNVEARENLALGYEKRGHGN